MKTLGRFLALSRERARDMLRHVPNCDSVVALRGRVARTCLGNKPGGGGGLVGTIREE